MGRLLKWKLKDLVDMAVVMLLNQFDFVVAVSGKRGLGKSTFSIVFARRISRQFRKLYLFDEPTIMYYFEKLQLHNKVTFEQFIERIIELKMEKKYQFKIQRNVIYRRNKIIEFFNDWNGVGVADEMVQSAFSRDFYNEEQKNLIKIINTNRDHENCFIFAIPSFQTTDNQLRNLTKMHITVLRRGVALVQSPNSTIFSADIWDVQNNQKVERTWLMKKTNKPNWAKLSTSRGFVEFPDLKEATKKIYLQHKTDERTIIAKEDYGIKDKVLEPVDRLVEQMINKGVQSDVMLKGFAIANDITYTSLVSKLKSRLRKQDRSQKMKDYYWDNGYMGEGKVKLKVKGKKKEEKIVNELIIKA